MITEGITADCNINETKPFIEKYTAAVIRHFYICTVKNVAYEYEKNDK